MTGTRLTGWVLLFFAVPNPSFGQADKKPAIPATQQKDAVSPELAKLRSRMDALQEEARKLHLEMRKLLDRDLKKLDETMRQAQKEMGEAIKARDRDAAAKAQEKLRQAQRERSRMFSERSRLHGFLMIRLDPIVRPRPNPEQELGIVSTEASQVLMLQLGLKKDVGRVIRMVRKDSPAAKAGVREHDVLVEVAGQPVPSDGTRFRALLEKRKDATPFEGVVLRAGKKVVVVVRD